jgi:transcriptional regulator with GAF, ATPase, and Fis domain
LESELFGHVKERSGAISPARSLEIADRDYLLGEIAALPLDTQSKLLRLSGSGSSGASAD